MLPRSPPLFSFPATHHQQALAGMRAGAASVLSGGPDSRAPRACGRRAAGTNAPLEIARAPPSDEPREPPVLASASPAVVRESIDEDGLGLTFPGRLALFAGAFLLCRMLLGVQRRTVRRLLHGLATGTFRGLRAAARTSASAAPMTVVAKQTTKFELRTSLQSFVSLLDEVRLFGFGCHFSPKPKVIPENRRSVVFRFLQGLPKKPPTNRSRGHGGRSHH